MLDHRLNTRTVYLNLVNRYLYWNMGYHVEHHMFPMVPYHNLDKLHALMKDDCPPPYNGLVAAYREVIPALIRQSKDPDYYVRRTLPAPSAPGGSATDLAGRHLQAKPDAEGWVEVCELDELVPGDVLRFEHGEDVYAIYRTSIGQLYATDGRCTHGERPARGRLPARAPASSARSTTAASTCAMARCAARRPRVPMKTYPVREKGGKVLLNVSATEKAG